MSCHDWQAGIYVKSIILFSSIGKIRLPWGLAVMGLWNRDLWLSWMGRGYSLSDTFRPSWHPKVKVFIRNCFKDTKAPVLSWVSFPLPKPAPTPTGGGSSLSLKHPEPISAPLWEVWVVAAGHLVFLEKLWKSSKHIHPDLSATLAHIQCLSAAQGGPESSVIASHHFPISPITGIRREQSPA